MREDGDMGWKEGLLDRGRREGTREGRWESEDVGNEAGDSGRGGESGRRVWECSPIMVVDWFWIKHYILTEYVTG